MKLSVHPVERTGDGWIAYGGSNLAAAHDPLQAHPAHQPSHRAPGGGLSLPPELPPDFAHAVYAEVGVEHALDVAGQDQVTLGPSGQTGWVSASGGMSAVGRWGDRQHLADRLDPVGPAVIVDERNHRLKGRSSSAWAKYADALRRISLPWRSSRFSRSSALTFALSSVVGPPRRPWSRSACHPPMVGRVRVELAGVASAAGVARLYCDAGGPFDPARVVDLGPVNGESAVSAEVVLTAPAVGFWLDPVDPPATFAISRFRLFCVGR